MPDREKVIKKLQTVANLCALNGDIQSMRTIDDALALLKEQEARWIPVTERLPEEKISPMTMDYTEYPCVFDGRDGQREVRYYKFGKGHFWHGSGCIDEYVTHWAEPMPLPGPPKEDENEGC